MTNKNDTTNFEITYFFNYKEKETLPGTLSRRKVKKKVPKFEIIFKIFQNTAVAHGFLMIFIQHLP